MRPFFAIFACLVLLASCAGDVENEDEEIAGIETDHKKNNEFTDVIFTDTIHEFYGISTYEQHYFGKDSYDTLVSIKNKTYRLKVECELDSNQRIVYNGRFPDGDKLYLTTQVGYQGYYTFSLFNGSKQLFKRKLTKEDFKESEYSWVIASDAFLPRLVEYNSAFDAFIFACPFRIEGSCSSTEALLVMGVDGKVQLVDYLSSPSGNSTNWEVQFTPGHKALVAHSAIHFPNGRSISFKKDQSYIMGTDVFDDCLLVVYEYDAKKHPKNAYLKDYNGTTLLNFKYTGWTGGLGFSFLREKVKNAHYFIDEDNNYLIRVRKEKGKWKYRNLPFSNMEEYNGIQTVNEVKVDLSTEVTPFFFYIDTESGKIRKTSPEVPNY